MATKEAETKVQLCSYCSAINFEVLRLPTAGQIRRSSDEHGNTTIPHLPPPTDLDATWDLDTVERIRQTAGTCTFCEVIFYLLDTLERAGKRVDSNFFCEVFPMSEGICDVQYSQHLDPAAPEGHGTNTGATKGFLLRTLDFRFTDVKRNIGPTDAARQVYAKQWAQIYSPQCPKTLFGDEGVSDDSYVFGHRKVPLLLNIETMISWKRECLSSHKASCYITPTNS